jgi:hypothetical protein
MDFTKEVFLRSTFQDCIESMSWIHWNRIEGQATTTYPYMSMTGESGHTMLKVHGSMKIVNTLRWQWLEVQTSVIGQTGKTMKHSCT